MAYIARSLTALLERTPADKAIVVFGARQTGKTTLLEHLFQDRKVKWLSGDEPQDRGLLASRASACFSNVWRTANLRAAFLPLVPVLWNWPAVSWSQPRDVCGR